MADGGIKAMECESLIGGWDWGLRIGDWWERREGWDVMMGCQLYEMEGRRGVEEWI